MDEIIKTENLTKHFGKVRAVEDLSLSIAKGEIYGFLGLNGAGKTTTIRMLLGMVRPTSGECFLNGARVHSGSCELWDKIGYLVEIPYSYPNLTLQENLEIVCRLRFIKNPAVIDNVIERLQLGPYRDRKVKNLSKGNAQRLGIAKAIISEPEILLLDEPAIGLDPAGIVEIRELLKDLALNKGVTVFISSHILGEISRFATRIGIIHEGKLIREADTDHLDSLRNRSLHVNTRNIEKTKFLLLQNGYSVEINEAGFLEVTGNDAITSPENVASLLVHEGYSPTLLSVEEEDLESYFFRTIEKNGGEI